ncbi:sugar ABC transporter substrate-binding protein [bacterium]|nr:MAG: sugar ABC transporter substrate-binding protein [bacterium]
MIPKRLRLGRGLIGVIALAAAVVLGGCGSVGGTTPTTPPSLVALLLPDNTTSRWEGQDRPNLIAAFKKHSPSTTVVVYNALNDPSKQQSQAEAALAKGAKVLIVIPVDAVAAASIVTEAHQQKVPVIAYSRLIKNTNLDYFIGKDSEAVGKIQGQWLADHTKTGDNIALINGSPTDNNAHLFNKGYMSVLKPLFDSNERHLVGDLWTDGWDPAKAQEEMEQVLTKTSNNVQGVLSANDGMAGGVIAALREHNLAGKVPVTGLDATLAGTQRILLGTQGMSVLQPIPVFADDAAQLSVFLIKGEKPPADFFQSVTKNGAVDVPTVFVPTVPITKDNIQVLIQNGLYTKADLCKDIPAGTGPC